MATQYQWGTQPIRPGQWCCPTHGPVTPDRTTAVPSCTAVDEGRRCVRALTVAEHDHRGLLVHRRPQPAWCAGRDRHPTSALGTMVLAHQPCGCVPGGHTVWCCVTCQAETLWPPCQR